MFQRILSFFKPKPRLPEQGQTQTPKTPLTDPKPKDTSAFDDAKTDFKAPTFNDHTTTLTS